MAVAVPAARRWGFSPKRLLPEPPRHRRVSKSAPPQHDRLGKLLEEWLAEQKIRYTYDGD
jgi:hypothetical protein